MTVPASINIAIYLLVLYRTCAQITSHFLCNSSYACDNDLLLCSTSSNCSVECSDDFACYGASINGFYANSLYLTANALDSAQTASIYCPSNLQNGIINYFDSGSNDNKSIPISLAIIDCSTQLGFNDVENCRFATFCCSNTDIIKIDCGATLTDCAECREATFYISNVNEFEVNIGSFRSCYDCNFYFTNLCYLSFDYYETHSSSSYQTNWVFDNIDMIYGNAKFWWHICTNSASYDVNISSSLIVIDHT